MERARYGGSCGVVARRYQRVALRVIITLTIYDVKPGASSSNWHSGCCCARGGFRAKLLFLQLTNPSSPHSRGDSGGGSGGGGNIANFRRHSRREPTTSTIPDVSVAADDRTPTTTSRFCVYYGGYRRGLIMDFQLVLIPLRDPYTTTAVYLLYIYMRDKAINALLRRRSRRSVPTRKIVMPLFAIKVSLNAALADLGGSGGYM